MKPLIFIAAGGTGGHIYPALAVAEAIKKQNDNFEIHFVGSPVGLETKIIPKQNYKLHLIPIGGLNQTSFLSKLLVILKMPLAFFKSVSLILKYKPQFIFGFGGYASGPVVLVGALLGVKTALFESNAIPGRTNRILSNFVKTSFLTFESSKNYLNSKTKIVIGFPVRAEMLSVIREPSTSFRILVFGGSQGARGINNTVSEAVTQGGEWINNLEIVHQTGRSDFTSIKQKCSNVKNVKVFEYLDPIKKYYDWADFVVCRAGASTIAELAACGKAALLIPFPFAADNHQQKNAEFLATRGAAVLCKQTEFTPDFFRNFVVNQSKQAQLVKKFEDEIKKLNKPDAAQKMATYVLREALEVTKL